MQFPWKVVFYNLSWLCIFLKVYSRYWKLLSCHTSVRSFPVIIVRYLFCKLTEFVLLNKAFELPFLLKKWSHMNKADFPKLTSWSPKASMHYIRNRKRSYWGWRCYVDILVSWAVQSNDIYLKIIISTWTCTRYVFMINFLLFKVRSYQY